MANRYWVGGTASWNSTGSWSASSGGASGATVPTSVDDVFFDQASTYTVTLPITPGQSCNNITVSAGTVTLVGTDSGTAATTFRIYGSVNIKSGTVWNFASSGAGQSVIFNSTTSQTITTNGVTLQGPHSFNGVGGNWQLQDALTFSTGLTLQNGTVSLNGNTLTAPTMATGGSAAKGIAFGSGNIALNGTGTVWSFNVTNLTISGTPTVNLTNTSGTARTLSPGSGTEAQAINFNVVGSGTLNFSSGAYGSLDFTGFTGSITAGINASFTFYGGLTFSSGMSVSFVGSNSSTFAATSGTKDLTFNGKTLNTNNAITFNGAGGTWRLQGTAAFGVGVTFTNGTIDLNGQQMTVPTLTTAAGTKNITFNGGTLVCTSSGTSWSNAQPTNFTTTAGTGTGTISMTSGTAKTFAGGGSTYNCVLSNDGAGALTISGSNTFTNLANSSTARTYTFTAGTTTTFTALGFSGAASNLITLGSTSTATYTISQSSGTVSCDYLSISRSVTTGGAAFYAGANSTNGGTNTGWTFTAAPLTGTSLNNFFFMF